jgi:hypothetical protein
VELGETETTAYRGDKGKVAYDHSQADHAPSDAEKNVQSDWDATEGAALILNKPTNLESVSRIEVTDTTHQMSPNSIYRANCVSKVILTLPSSMSKADGSIKVHGIGTGGWKIAQNPGQQIVFGSFVTTVGISGYIESNSQYECVEIECVVDNLLFLVVTATGNPEVV